MPAPNRYLLFHKPYGVLSQFTPEEGSSHGCLADYIDVPGVYAVGRLDGDSEGLLLLTSDGTLQHELTNPRHGHPRTYWAQVEGIPDNQAIQSLCLGGIPIQGYSTRPALARLLEEVLPPPRNPPIRQRLHIPTAWLELTLTEGRNRQVRRMTAAVGYPTLRLIRVAIGNLRLEDLSPGCWRDLTPGEVATLREWNETQLVRDPPKRRPGSGG